MKKINTILDGVFIIENNLFQDDRGWFCESYSASKFAELGINTLFIQDNHSMSKKRGTLRGLHFQNSPFAQTKLVRCTRGAILDVAVDLRKGSSTYKMWVAIELSETNMKQLYIPKGFAHGFVTLSEETEVQYKVDAIYSALHDRSIRYDDPELNITWPINDLILSAKDANAPNLCDCDVDFGL